MSLSQKQRSEAERKLKLLSTEMNVSESIKIKIKEQSKKIQGLVNQVRQSGEQNQAKIEFIGRAAEQVMEETVKLESLEAQLTLMDEKIKSQKEKAVTERIRSQTEKEKYEEAIKDIKTTIDKIQKTVKDSQSDETQKRESIEKDLDKSLNQIRDKINIQDQEAKAMNLQTADLKQQSLDLRAKLQALQTHYDSKAAQKESEIKQEKTDLLDQLKVLEHETSVITKANNQFNIAEKKNFDNKLTLYIKQTKFSDYAGSFENTARVLSQCKDELFKGVQRVNELQTKRDTFQAKAQKYDKEFLSELGNSNTLKGQIEGIKKAKEAIRSNILALQTDIKAKKAQN